MSLSSTDLGRLAEGSKHPLVVVALAVVGMLFVAGVIRSPQDAGASTSTAQLPGAVSADTRSIEQERRFAQVETELKVLNTRLENLSQAINSNLDSIRSDIGEIKRDLRGAEAATRR